MSPPGRCQWPSGCERMKRPGKGARYCLPHEMVGTVKEVRRKRRAAKESRNKGLVRGKNRGHDAGDQAALNTPLERYYWRQYRAVLREFGLK